MLAVYIGTTLLEEVGQEVSKFEMGIPISLVTQFRGIIWRKQLVKYLQFCKITQKGI